MMGYKKESVRDKWIKLFMEKRNDKQEVTLSIEEQLQLMWDMEETHVPNSLYHFWQFILYGFAKEGRTKLFYKKPDDSIEIIDVRQLADMFAVFDKRQNDGNGWTIEEMREKFLPGIIEHVGKHPYPRKPNKLEFEVKELIS